MKIYKITIILSIILSIASFVAAFIFDLYSGYENNYSFWSNIFIGIFTGALITLFSAIVNYIIFKEKFYKELLIKFSYLLYYVEKTTDLLKNRPAGSLEIEERNLLEEMIREMGNQGEELAPIVRTYDPFIKYTKKNDRIYCLLQAFKYYTYYLKNGVDDYKDITIKLKSKEYHFKGYIDYFEMYCELHQMLDGTEARIVI